MTGPVSFATIEWRGRPVRIEYQWLGSADEDAPLVVFLHEGLGSRAMWRDFPQMLCERCACRGLVYSRPGYGRSTPRAPDELWGVDFMHRQAHEVLPVLFDALEIDPQEQPLWLLGHSDGGSIALLFAARYLNALAGAIVIAPHVMVEDLSILSIERARSSYLTTDLRERLARYHDDVDSAFWGWNRIWLDPEFRAWSIVPEIAAIRCPLLAIQGIDDEYGTLEQIRAIGRAVPQTELLELADAGHSAHRDQGAAVLDAIASLMRQHARPPSGH